ncbi:MAG TPA: outer membrane protein transport protein [Rudaea sp.]|nr:outer membrane protein transport protein [Rudaea sp.]
MKRQLSLAIGAALVGLAGPAFAITDTETNASIPFNLANPGARSMGMGGAFLGLADDATAAYTNPAGLSQLVTPEISIEGRHTNYSLPYLNSGSVTTNPFNGSGLHTADADSSVNNVSFLSIVYPHDRWSFAFYRDELVRFNNDFSSTPAGEPVDNGATGVVLPIVAHADLKIVNYGLSAAWKASDNISLGAGLSYYDFNIDTSIHRLAFPNIQGNIPTGNVVNRQDQFGSDNDVGINLGARFVFNEQWSGGLVYRRGPRFEYNATNTAFYRTDGSVLNPPVVVTNLNNVRFKVPDEYGAGVSWHPTDSLVVNFDADYIPYSQLTRGIQSLFGSDAAVVSRLSIPNGTEIHLGGEYTFTQMAHPFSIRAGVWHDPRHSIEFTGDPGTNSSAIPLAILFSGGQGSQTHGALGFGWAFSKFQIDAAADFSDVTDTYSVSAVYHF